MKTLMEKLNEQVNNDARQKAYKDLASVRATVINLRLPSHAKVMINNQEVPFDIAFNQLHDEMKRLLTERNINNKTNAIIKRLAAGE